MSSDLQYRPRGSLKLKGEADGGKKKKSKKKNASKLELTGEEPVKSESLLKRKEATEGPSAGGTSDSPSGTPGGSNTPMKTEAERRFEQIQRRRLLDKVSKMASKTHKDRVQEFNAKLEQASDHHDIPKVGPG
ncbi:hypothetical protein FRC14_006498 [Serendipita sp. 396]|nr:hypothetical protein FRC14_006498 [Serendipita sp. 396]KAG8787173.1 hypothetical protein FRC15_009839 [Serendipita sp. 397]KAG8802701.1 hypothetical protein FRC16_008970 [Serendipita sp. 398]KAG8809061.1 hypothetical protein FRC18_004745 [Serendipita sp. 400]KAG8824776.1 hypothetical protein FRC19_001070 [Serendipita sp. 401]KAG8872662.1 hypothetical protein FRC20_009188 [Serendipita sp. 405]KAG9054916.1 hypothetical protein FS842_003757 [Serendipita sp. 407]